MTVLRPAKFSLPAPPARLSTGQPGCLRHRLRAIESFLQKAYNTTIKVKATLQLNKQQIALRKAALLNDIQLIFFKPSKPIAQTEFVNQRDNGTRVYVNVDSNVKALEVGREVRGAAAETVQAGDEVRQTGDGAVEGIVNEGEERYNEEAGEVDNILKKSSCTAGDLYKYLKKLIAPMQKLMLKLENGRLMFKYQRVRMY